MPQALPYIFYAAVAASTYSAVSSAQSAARSASTIGDLNAAATARYGEENAQATTQLSEENAQAAEQQGESQAQVAQRQAATQFQQAQAEALAIRRQNDRIRGTQRVAFLKSGVTLSGSAQDVIYDSAIEGELEALNTTYRGSVSSSYYMDEAALARSSGATQATLLRNRGETEARLTRSKANIDATMSAYEGGARAKAYRAESVGSFFRGVATAASGPSFT